MNFTEYLEIGQWFIILLPPVLFALLVWMNLFATYPMYFDKQIRRGKNWVFVPRFWKAQKVILKPLHYLLLLLFILSLSLALLMAMMNVIPWELSWWILPIFCGVIAVLFAILTQIHFAKRRYIQQEKCYFNDLFQAIEEMEHLGHRTNEQELRSRVSWEHQSAFLKADEAGQFLKLLNDRSKRK